MAREKLEESGEKISENVGLAVSISQAVVTTIVVLGYSFLFLEIYFPNSILFWVLVYEMLAIALHLLFRKWERGKAQGKSKGGKRNDGGVARVGGIIFFHSAVSVLAIAAAFAFLDGNVTLIPYLIILVSWLVSFSSGVMLYKRSTL